MGCVCGGVLAQIELVTSAVSYINSAGNDWRLVGLVLSLEQGRKFIASEQSWPR